MRYVLAADLGASSLRMAAVDASGGVHALTARPLETVSPAPGRREQDAGDWWRHFTAMAQSVLDTAGGAPAAVAVTGGTRTQVVIDEGGRPLAPAIMWDDSRAAAQAGRLAARFDSAGNPVTAYHPAARLAWLAETRPRLLEKASAVLQPKDYIVRRLTGCCFSDPISSWTLLDDDGNYRVDLLDAAGARRTLMPELAAPEQAVGGVVAAEGMPAALAGTPVFCASMDTWCCALPLGAYRAGAVYNLSGTSEVVGLIDSARRFAGGVLTVPWGGGLWHLGGPSQCGGRTLAWARGILGATDGNLDDILPRAPVAADAPLFVPYLEGERTPWWNPDLTGGWLALRARHDRAALIGAVVEGIAFHVRAIIEAVGVGDEPVVLGGGLARSRAWCQARADVLDRTVRRTSAEEPGLAGAAMVAMTGLGWHRSLDESRSHVATFADSFEPDPAARSLLDTRYRWFRDEIAARIEATGRAAH